MRENTPRSLDHLRLRRRLQPAEQLVEPRRHRHRRRYHYPYGRKRPHRFRLGTLHEKSEVHRAMEKAKFQKKYLA